VDTEPKVPDPNEPELTGRWVDAARTGDQAAFTKLFEHLAPALYTWADLRLHRGQRAQVDPADVVQEVWLRAWRGLESFDPAETPFRPWLFRVAKNVLLEAGRQVARARQAGGLGPTTRLFALENLPDPATAISRRLARDEGLGLFIEGVRGLPVDDRKLVLHIGLEGLPRQEVATRLGLSTEAVTKRWQRLRQKLQDSGLPDPLVLDG
jgi:RNA polymerase sigma-70 factor, ECF subfamily